MTGLTLSGVPPSGPEIGRDDLRAFGEWVEARFGHERNAARQDDLRLALSARMQATGSRDYTSYTRLLKAGEGEWVALAPLLTVPETYFFRMPDHFRALAEEVLPKVIEANRTRRTLRILAAGCATGEEPYSIKILLREQFPQLAGWKVTLAGVDLSEEALIRARAGVYSEWSLRATSAERRRANFTTSPDDKKFRLLEAVKQGVEFRRENLLDPASALPDLPYDIIFCRNVLIYFSESAIRRTIARLSDRLVPGGYLFLGPAESLRGVSRNFHLCHAHEVFFYRRRDRLAPEEEQRVPRVEAGSAPAVSLSRTTPIHPPSPADTWYDSIQESSSRLASLMRPAPAADYPPARKAARPRPPGGDPPASGFDSSRFFALVAEERFAEALTLLEPPGTAAVSEDHRVLRAGMLANLGRFAEAERECRMLLEADELNAAAHYLLGFSLEQMGAAGDTGTERAGRLQQARDQMTRTAFLDPSFAMAHLHLGLLARQEGDTSAARASLRSALSALERDEPGRLALFGGGFSRESLRQLCQRELEGLGP